MNVSDCIPGVDASPVVSPLATRQDAVGQSLQKTMIWAPPDARLSSSFVAFRKNWTLAAVPKTATLHLFADVRFLVWINGRYTLRGPSRFEPGGPEFDSMDVARFLEVGENSIVVLVMSNGSNGKMRKHAPGLTLRLEADGKTALSSDETWKWSDQTRYRNPDIDWGNAMDRIDARVEDGDWTRPNYNDDAWKGAVKVDGEAWGPLSARRTPLLRETPIAFKLTDGQNLPVTLSAGQKLSFSTDKLVQAYTVVELDAGEGTEVSLDYSHVRYIARAGRQTYISSDTFGFFGGSISVKSGRATITALKLVERLYPFDVAGSFESSDEMLNRLWAMCARSCQVLSEDSYVDCADRERTEWMDDDPPAFDITRTALVGVGDDGQKVFADARLLGALLRRTALTVQPEGWVKAHTASDRFDIHAQMEDRACDWVEGARRYYESTGDKALLREIWPVVVRQMNYFLQRRTPRGLVLGREWEVWGNPLGYVSCEGAGLNAFVYKALVDAAFVGEAIGEREQSAKFSKAATELSRAFNTVLWNEKEGTYFSGTTQDLEKARGGRNVNVPFEDNFFAPTMLSALFALDQNIVPESRRAQVTAYVFAHRDEANRIMMFYYLFKQQYRADRADFDREILDSLRTNWKAMAGWPWQTSWEEFDGASKAHIYGMFPGYFLSSYVLGVRLDGAVWNKRLLIEPRLGDLTSAQGKVVTEFGVVPVSWKVEGETLKFRVEVPAGVKAILRIPQMGTNARLTFDGKAGAAQKTGRYFSLEVGAGVHSGGVSFVKAEPPLPIPTTPVTARTSPVAGAFETEVATNDLINLGQPTLLSVSNEKVTNDGGANNADAIHNGVSGSETRDDGHTYRGYGEGDSITFNLNTALHPAGYDLSRIASFAGHGDSRASQNYAVFVAFVSDVQKFLPLFASVSVACGGGSSQLVLANPQGGAIEGDSGLKARGVAAIRFEFRGGSAKGGAGLGFNVYREIDVVGKPTATNKP